MNKSPKIQEIGCTKSVIAAFDFDGTITTKDTFVPFLRKAFGTVKLFFSLITLAIPGLMVVLRLSNRDRFKSLLIGKLFAGASVERLEAIGLEHAKVIVSFYRPAALDRIKWHKDQGHKLVLISASLSFYLEPVARQLGFEQLLCTRVKSFNGICSGELNGGNCRAREKVRRLEELLGSTSQYEIYAYGDSEGDTEMLNIADHSEFSPFI